MLILFTFDTEEDKDKFIRIYNKYLKTVYYTVTRFVSELHDLEDLSQEAFLRISENLDKIELAEPVKTRNYIITITRNLCKNHLRESSHLSSTSYEELPEDLKDTALSENKYSDISELLQKNELKEKLTEAISGLPDIYRSVLELKYVTDLSNKEIAAFLNIRKKTVEIRLYRAVQMLKDRLWEFK